MFRKSALVWLSLIVMASIALSGCAPRPGAGETMAAAGNGGIAVDLPAIEIDFDDNGQASFGGTPIAQLGSALGTDLSAVAVPADYLAMLKTANIQHIQINNTTEGLIILINGKAIPSIGLDGGAAVGLADVAKLIGFNQPGLEKLLPTINRLGIGIIAKFPKAEGAADIPITGGDDTAQAANSAQESFIKTVGTPGVINLPVYYADDGSWTVADMTDTEWANLTGDPIWQAYRMKPEVVAGFKAKGIKELTVSTDAKGLHISINGQALPYITWADGKLNNLVDLASEMGLLGSLGSNADQIKGLIDQWLPVLTANNVNLRVFFPQ
ncbi:MAG: hypothetical protein U0175_37075 [Caldilineaceae bacterium]